MRKPLRIGVDGLAAVRFRGGRRRERRLRLAIIEQDAGLAGG